jgi:ribosomal protein S18 acetylase RimI-like enzyme
MIYVLPEYQGKGIGKLLWNELSKYLDINKETFVEVATYNENAIKFYEKLGFVDTNKRFTDERFRMRSGGIIPQMEMKLHEIGS